MAEPLGIAASAVTLAALFSKCIDCFSYFKAAQNCSAEAETLLVKLDCEKARLLVWANTVGILRTEHQRRYPQLGDPDLETLIRQCITQIIGLLTDAQKLQAEYGGRPTTQGEDQRAVAVVSVNSMNLFKTARFRFFARTGGLGESPNWLSRIKWAIRDGAKFRILLSHRRDFVDSVIQLVPVPPDVINHTVEEDITTIIDISHLRLAESACEENYPKWSTRASEVIKESELGKVDRRNFEEIIRDTDEPKATKTVFGLKRNQTYPGISSIRAKRTFVVLTDDCLNIENGTYCGSGAKAIATTRRISFSCPNTVQWNLGRRILNMIKPPFESQAKMNEAESRRFLIHELTEYLPKVVPVSRIYIYCGPCACALQTALILTQDNGASDYIDYAILIDERLPTSCHRSITPLDFLIEIRDTLQEHEVEDYDPVSRSLGYIDIPELERRIYDIEQEKPGPFGGTSSLHQILLEHMDFHGWYDRSPVPTGAIIIVAETDSCQIPLEKRPFQSEARKPRETELYSFEPVWNAGDWLLRRRYVGSYSRSEEAIERNKVRSN